MIANNEQVFVNATTSISALGKQKDLTGSKDSNITLSSIPVENHHALFYALKDTPLNKSFELMMDLLYEQVESLLEQTQFSRSELKNTMLFIGSTSLDIGCIKPNSTKEIWLSQTDKIGQLLVSHFSLHSLHYTFNTACTAGANALLYATNFIKQRKTEHAIVIGFEFFNQLSINGFDSLDLISNTSVKPFSPLRDGLILGEGIGAVLLSKKQTERTQLEVMGGYSSCDDYSLTITDEEGNHIVNVIEKSLLNANITLQEINLIKVHGTASIKSDLAEYNAICKLFIHMPKVFALKPLIGHTLGACGVIELALTDYFTQNAYLPLFTYQNESTEQLLLPFIASANQLPQEPIMLFNHFGFGGNNAALIIKKLENT